MRERRRILVTGGTGQIGLELGAVKWPEGYELFLPGRDELNLNSSEKIASYVADGNFSCIINCAAWTAVDNAEDHVSQCFLANAQGPAWLAEAARGVGASIVHVSTDYVFDGALARPYRETDPVGPVSTYGASKLAGEYAVRHANPRSVVLRTAWVLSQHRTNFLKTMLRLGAERSELGVVGDQTGCPTSAKDIACAIARIATRLLDDADPPAGVYHFVNAGEASWFELARTIFEMAEPYGHPRPRLKGIATSDFPTRASRPANSRLDTTKIAKDFGIAPRPWTEAIQEIVRQVLTASTDGEECGK